MAPCASTGDDRGVIRRTVSRPLPQPRNLIGTCLIGTCPIGTCLIGIWRRFGVTGPVYEIVRVGQTLDDDDGLMRVRLVETGEEVDDRFTDILDDPREQ
ncbi:DUF5397 family protein [Methylobacterium currus]|uniref:DUF5397 family protein n=1 Tax=Methylobacterium currus TaxID=2051553 RepID=UPI001FD2F40D|nr:DUF5397 family protein [Methylobacterium currus]